MTVGGTGGHNCQSMALAEDWLRVNSGPGICRSLTARYLYRCASPNLDRQIEGRRFHPAQEARLVIHQACRCGWRVCRRCSGCRIRGSRTPQYPWGTLSDRDTFNEFRRIAFGKAAPLEAATSLSLPRRASQKNIRAQKGLGHESPTLGQLRGCAIVRYIANN